MKPVIDQAGIRALIPHAGNMALLDGVTAWNAETIHCLSDSHRRPDNPLRRQGRLAALHAFEYCAQAVAVHGGLLAQAAGRQAPPAYLAALRDARLHVAALDDVASPLEVVAIQLLAGVDRWLYATRVSAAGTAVAEARVTIVARPEYAV